MNKRKILVVNDDPDLAHVLTMQLVQEGYEDVISCSSAKEALSWLSCHTPDLIISDIHMSELDGFQFCRLLKSSEYQCYSHIPVLLSSASFRDRRATQLARDSGASAFIQVPCDQDELATMVRDQLNGTAVADTKKGDIGLDVRVLLVTSKEEPLTGETSEFDGFTVSLATDAIAAQNMSTENEYDIIVVDSELPLIGAATLLKWLREKLHDIPLVVVTTRHGEKEVEGLLKAGADDFLAEPMTMSSLADACRRALAKQEFKKTSVELETNAQRLRASENRCRKQRGFLDSLIDGSADGIIACDGDLSVNLFNPSASSIFGVAAERALGRPLGVFMGEELAESLKSFIELDAAGRSTQMEVERRQNDEEMILSVVASRVGEAAESPQLLLVVRDVTRERKLLRHLAQSQKIDSIGALAGGLAHDFNNILTTILPNAELICMVSPPDSDAHRRAATIESAAKRGGELTNRLLSFSRPRSAKPEAVDSNESIANTMKLLKETLDRKIRIESHLEPNLASVFVDPAQLEHVLLNLSINARDALNGGGKIRFESRNVAEGDSRLDRCGLPSGAFVLISVEDDGRGMNPEIADKIFDPFFTTKAEGYGTGLGLSTAYAIIKTAGGIIDVHTCQGEGSRFDIYLPATREKRVEKSPQSGLFSGDGEAVLVIDDEAGQRDLLSEMLARLSYRVHTVGTGVEALDFCREARQVDLVILDMIMPDMDGLETYRHLKKLNPDLSFLLTSGDPADPRAEDIIREGVSFLQKPYSWAKLSDEVRRALDSSSELSRTPCDAVEPVGLVGRSSLLGGE